MTKADLIEKVAKNATLTKTDAGKCIDALIDAVTVSLKKGQKVTLIGFGTFSVLKRKARKGRNPQTGKEIKDSCEKSPQVLGWTRAEESCEIEF